MWSGRSSGSGAEMEKVDKKVFLALHLLLLLFAGTTVLSKLAAGEAFLSLRFCLFFGGEFVLLGIYALGWQQILKRLPLTVAYTNKAVTDSIQADSRLRPRRGGGTAVCEGRRGGGIA